MDFDKGCSCNIPMVFLKYSQFTNFECVMTVSDHHRNDKYGKYYFRAWKLKYDKYVSGDRNNKYCFRA